MKFINLEELKIKKQYEYLTANIEIGNIETLLSMPIKKLFSFLEEKIKPIDGENVCYKFNYQGCCENEEEFAFMVDNLISCLISKITNNSQREREHRLGIPKNLLNVNIKNIYLLRLVNFNTLHKNINIIVTSDEENSLRYGAINE